jgi:general secretion pathway protein K
MDNLRASALLTALFIMTLVAIAATAISTRVQYEIYRTRLLILSDKLYLASQGIVFWGMDRLTKKSFPLLASGSDAKMLNYQDTLAIKEDYPEFTLSGGLYDLQAKYNLNNMIGNNFQSTFYLLLKSQPLNIDINQQKSLAAALHFWVTPYQLGKGKDPFQDYYFNQSPPFYSSNMPLRSTSELRLLPHVSTTVFDRIAPMITVLPETTAINLNTASKPILMALGNGLSSAAADEIINARGGTGFEDYQKLVTLIQKEDIPEEQITLSSKYFLIVAQVKTKDMQITNYSVVKREKSSNGIFKVSLVSESLNTQ